MSSVGSVGNAVSHLRSQIDELERTVDKLKELVTARKGAASPRTSSSSSSSSKARSSSASSSRPKIVGSYAGPQGFLWKPISDSNGRLAILLPPGLTGMVSSVSVLAPDGRVLEAGKASGVANGGREHFRFSRPGGAFPVGSQVLIQLQDGRTQRITIQTPGARVEGRS